MKIFRHKVVKVLSVFLAVNLLFQLVFPTVSFALTSGPTQPEVQGFKPIGVSDMVEAFSGDFSYNLPLLDVGGYPINLSYNANITMDQEASWVGLGWSLTPGVINRSVRGVPDDFKGDEVIRQFNMKPQRSFGINGGINFKLFGLEDFGGKLNASLGLGYSNYDGYQFEIGLTPSLSASKVGKGKLDAGLGLSASSSSGVDISPSISYSVKTKASDDLTYSLGSPYNSREGLKSLTLGVGYTPHHGYQCEQQNGGTELSFAKPTYIMKPESQTTNYSLSFAATFGAEIFGGHPDVKLGGYGSFQTINSKKRGYNSYGYLYEQNSKSSDILDFNREKDGPFSSERPYLPLANHTYDVYSVAGQGISGSYRPFRNDIGVVHDPDVKNLGSGSVAGGLEIGVGNLAHSGAQVVVTVNTNESGKWSANNYSLQYLNYKNSGTNPESEQVYLKQAGEKICDPEISRFNNLGGFEPTRVAIGQTNKEGEAYAQFEIESSNQISSATSSKNMSDVSRTKRLSRNQNITYLTASIAKDFAQAKDIVSYQINDFSFANNGYQNATSIKRTEGYRKNHHLSEITTLKSDGTRYVFGIPAYNTFQSEQTFSVNGENSDREKGLVSYDQTMASANNNQGSDHYFDQTQTPPFAHSYLLTEVLSTDYEDIKSDGPTPDDIGTYTRINYSKAYSNYKWRTPYEPNKANYIENFKSVPGDDKGSYVEGEKEIWYMHSIETKTQVAEFYVSNREDGLGAGKESLYKLDSIRLFNREDKIQNTTNAIPIKVVHFEYTYDLCKGIPNSSSQKGKLTLSKIFFTFGTSKKGKFSPYTFDYSKCNPYYNIKGSDRWGHYKPNMSDGMSNGEYPYSVQDPNNATTYASAWALTAIKLPSGGKIAISYEPDDYSYVQNKAAMRMFMVVGAGKTSSYTSNNTLYGNEPNNYLYFKLDSRANTAADIQYYKKDLVGNQMYFKFLIDINSNGKKEYVPGYIKVEDVGICADNPNYGFVRIQKTGIEYKESGENANPISKAGWQYVRINHPRVAYGQADENENGSLTDLATKMFSVFKQIQQMFTGINSDMKNRDFCKTFETGKSWIRLYEPTGFKYGGGNRVKKITISDEWKSMDANGISSEYGQEYSYTKQEGGRIISSGVATYEPIIGNEENPFRTPIFIHQDKLLAPGNETYVETPFGESFFPSPSVGYSKVTVKSVSPSNVTKHATGLTVSEFYTSKDFPTKVKITTASYKRNKPTDLGSLLKFRNIDYMVASQGFVVELNDMNGKPKANYVFPQGKDVPISSVEYKYDQLSENEISSDALVLNKNGTVSKNLIGVDYDIVSDMRNSLSTTQAAGVSANLDAFFAIFGFAIPTLFPILHREETGFRSATLTKVINRSGLLKETIAKDLGSIISTKNLLYDAVTGEVLLTETVNQNDNHVFNFTYPAHWAYKTMEPSYINNGVIFSNSSIAANKEYFVSGDELGVTYGDGSVKRIWINAVTPSGISAISDDGTSVNVDESLSSILVVRSGRRNMQAISVGNVSCMENPLKDADGDGAYDKIELTTFKNVLNAGATEYGTNWKLFCTCNIDYSTQVYNPFIVGAKSKIKPLRSYVYLTERTQTNNNGKTNIKTDGVFTHFTPFWLPPQTNNGEWVKDAENWQYTSEITEFSPDGLEIENKDALGRYNSALYGYRKQKNTAVANNAKAREIGYDGFEDYLDECSDDHFSFRKYKETSISETESHTGKRSIRVDGRTSVSLRKVIKKCE